jgi:hypothetical protein
MAGLNRNVSLVERGDPVLLSTGQLIGTPLQAALERLGDLGVLGVRGLGSVTLVEPRNFIGYLAYVGGGVRIVPKNMKVFDQIVQVVRGYRRKEIEGAARGRLIGDAGVDDPGAAFAVAAEVAFGRGLPFEYLRTAKGTSTPRGRVLFNPTIRRFASRGIRHKSVCSVAAPVPNRRLNGLLVAVANLVIPTLEGSLRRKLEFVRGALSGGSVRLSLRDAKELVPVLRSEFSNHRDVQLVLAAASAVLEDEESIQTVFEHVADGEYYRFVDSDRLWERAVHELFKRALTDQGELVPRLHPLSGVCLLEGGGPEIDPDLVCFRSGRPELVLDAKNSVCDSARADDIYQIVCYVDRLGARRGLLVYIAGWQGWSSTIGVTSGGAVVSAIGVDQGNIVRDLMGRLRTWALESRVER